jgi:Fe-S cluster biogenesis protein NfuA
MADDAHFVVQEKAAGANDERRKRFSEGQTSMATINSLASSKYNVVSVAAATKVIIVSGDATSQIVANSYVRLVGTSATNALYQVSGAAPVFSAGNTTFVVTTALGDCGGIGTCNLVRNGKTAASWVGGVAPNGASGSTDTGVIVSGADLYISLNAIWFSAYLVQSGGNLTIVGCSADGTIEVQGGGELICGDALFVGMGGETGGLILVDAGGSALYTNGAEQVGMLVCSAGGSVEFDAATQNGGLIVLGTSSLTNSSIAYGPCIVEKGGNLSLSGDTATGGAVTVENGGSCTFTAITWAGTLVVESGGSATLTAGSTNCTGAIIVESGGSLAIPANMVSWNLVAYQNANITGSVVAPSIITKIPLEKRTTHYTSGASDGIASKITIRNSSPANVLYSMQGTYLSQCLPANIVEGFSIAEIAGTLDMSTYTAKSGVAAAADVRHGTATYASGPSGTCYVPTANQVLSGVSVDATTGNITFPPSVGDVVAGVQYGPGGNLYTGTAVLTEGELTDALSGIAANITTILRLQPALQPQQDAGGYLKSNLTLIAGQNVAAQTSGVQFPPYVAEQNGPNGGVYAVGAMGEPLATDDSVTALGSPLQATDPRLPAAGKVIAAVADLPTIPATVVLAASQPNYAPAKAGDAVTLTVDYDKAKTAASSVDVAAAILTTPANKLATHANGSIYLPGKRKIAVDGVISVADDESNDSESTQSQTVIKTVQVHDVLGNPIGGVAIHATTDRAGRVFASQGTVLTDSSGTAVVTFTSLGSLWLWREKIGVTIPSPIEIAVV